MEKENKKQQKKPELHDYIITVDALAPVTLTFKVEAENEDQALGKINRLPDQISKPNFGQAKRLKAIVKKKGSNMILKSKKL